MFARSSSYSMVKFSPDGQSVVTCFGDGTLYQWSLATNDLEKQFAMSNITIFDFSSDKSLVYGISKDLTIKVWRLDHPNKIQFGLSAIPGVKEFKQIECHDNYVVLNANNGRLYFVNPEQNKVEVEFQIGTLFINEFQIAKDKLFLITSNGIVHMYDINVLIQKHNNSANKRLTMGLSEGLVYTLLVRNEYKEAFINPRPESNPPLHSKEDVLFTKLGSGVSLSSSSSASLSEISQCQHELFTSLFQQAKIDPHNSRIQHCQMRRVLHYYGEYPENYRSLIWRFLLQTPGNREAFNGLTSRGTHPNLADLFKNLKEVSHSEFEKTEKVCSALVY